MAAAQGGHHARSSVAFLPPAFGPGDGLTGASQHVEPCVHGGIRPSALSTCDVAGELRRAGLVRSQQPRLPRAPALPCGRTASEGGRERPWPRQPHPPSILLGGPLQSPGPQERVAIPVERLLGATLCDFAGQRTTCATEASPGPAPAVRRLIDRAVAVFRREGLGDER